MNTTEVLAVLVPDSPGGALPGCWATERRARQRKISLFLCAKQGPGETRWILFKVDQVSEAARVLHEAGIQMLDQPEIIAL